MKAAILAIDQNNGLGYKNNILFKNQKDMNHFVTITKQYKDCFVGRKTAESLKYNLKDRNLYVYTRDLNKPPIPGVVYCQIQDGLLNATSLTTKDKYIVIGGNQIYKLFMYEVDTWYVTQFKESAKNVDVYLDIEILNYIKNTNLFNCSILDEDENLIILKYTKLK